MVLSFIPDDIIYLIIDHLDFPALRSCSLAARAFLPACRTRLFATLTLTHPRHSRGLHRALTTNPGLARYIHALAVLSGPQPETRLRDWVTLENTLPAVLQLLHALRTLTFCNTAPGALPWAVLPAELRAALLGLAVAALTLDRVGSPPPADLARLIHLRRLVWLNVAPSEAPHHHHPGVHAYTVAPRTTVYSPHTWGTGHLEYLEIKGSPRSGHRLVDALRLPTSPLSIVHLRELVLYGNCAFAKDITAAAAPSLEHFTWRQLGAEEEGPFASEPIHLGGIHTLTLSTKFARGRPSDPLPSLIHTLRAVPPHSPSPLHTLAIVLDFSGVWKFSVTARDVQDICEYEVWAALDEVLAGPAFPALRSVRVGLMVSDRLGEFKPLVGRQMPRLVGAGILVVE